MDSSIPINWLNPFINKGVSDMFIFHHVDRYFCKFYANSVDSGQTPHIFSLLSFYFLLDYKNLFEVKH